MLCSFHFVMEGNPVPLFLLWHFLFRLLGQNTVDGVAYNSRHFFLTFLEAGGPISRHQQTVCLVRTCFPVSQWPSFL